jgi:hypothetical protein
LSLTVCAHKVLGDVFAALGAAAPTAPRALAAGNKREHWAQLSALFCAEPLAARDDPK